MIEQCIIITGDMVGAVICVSAAVASGPSPEPVYYLGNLGQSAFPTPTADATYGQVNVACRTGWRFIEPVSTTVHAPDWTTIDACHTAAAWLSRKWSLSIKIGADAPHQNDHHPARIMMSAGR